VTHPKPKQIAVITEVLEGSFKKKSVGLEVSGSLASILFPYDTKVPKDMGELREELEQRGYLCFYSEVMKKDEQYLSVNITKID
jgi:homoserine kinase